MIDRMPMFSVTRRPNCQLSFAYILSLHWPSSDTFAPWYRYTCVGAVLFSTERQLHGRRSL